MNRQNESDRSKAKIINVATLRAVVAGYLFYLGFTILRDLLAGNPGSLPVWLLWMAGILFIVSALAFGYYTWRQYQKEMLAFQSTGAEETNAAEEKDDA